MMPGAGVLVLGCGHESHIVRMDYYFFLKSSSLLLGIDQTNYKYIVIMTKEDLEFTKIVNFMTPGAEVPGYM